MHRLCNGNGLVLMAFVEEIPTAPCGHPSEEGIEGARGGSRSAAPRIASRICEMSRLAWFWCCWVPAVLPVSGAFGAEVPLDSGQFEGRLLLAISDGDMPASAYVDGRLRFGHDRSERSDTLTVIELPLGFESPPDREIGASELAVPNSVIGSPFALAVGPRGDFAYVLETYGSAPEEVDRVPNVYEGFSEGGALRAVVLSDPRPPRIVDEIRLGRSFHTVDVHPDGTLLVACSDLPDRQIGLIEVDRGIFGRVHYFPLLGVGDSEALTGNAQWHRSGRFFAVTLTMLDSVAFYELVRGESTEGPEIRAWGEPVKVGKFPYSGIWTPDGRYFITTDDQWGEEVAGFYVDPPPGELSVIEFVDEGSSQDVWHRVVSRARGDVSPEGIAVSPDGRLVVTANLVRSFLPWDDPRLTQYSSMSLFDLDPSTGRIEHVTDYRILGIMPESLVFDPTGRSLAVAVFERFDPRDGGGAIEFWTVERRDRARLIPSGYSISVAPGAHTLVLVP